MCTCTSWMRHRTRVYPSSAISLSKSATADLDAQAPESILPVVVMDSGLARSLSSGRALRGPVGAPRNDVKLSSLRRSRLPRPRFDLADCIDHGIEGQHGGSMPRLVVAHRLEQRDVGPLALRGAAVFLQHLPHGLAQFAQFARRRADDVARPDRGPGLAQSAALHIMGQIPDPRPLPLHVALD